MEDGGGSGGAEPATNAAAHPELMSAPVVALDSAPDVATFNRDYRYVCAHPPPSESASTRVHFTSLTMRAFHTTEYQVATSGPGYNRHALLCCVLVRLLVRVNEDRSDDLHLLVLPNMWLAVMHGTHARMWVPPGGAHLRKHDAVQRHVPSRNIPVSTYGLAVECVKFGRVAGRTAAANAHGAAGRRIVSASKRRGDSHRRH